MIQGTTPKHVFVLPFHSDAVKSCEILYWQNGNEILKKTLDSCVAEGTEISVKLTQSETFLFADDAFVEIQLRVLTHDGEALASKVMQISVHRCLSQEVLV